MNNAHLKFRITIGDTVAMGPGKAQLLKAIDATGSISAAAKSMNMSYRRAWGLVDVMNKSFTEALVTSSPGGQHGGGAKVTTFGFMILKNYEAMINKANKAAKTEIDQITSHLKDPD